MTGAFAAGTFMGSMLHPWGGYYPSNGGGYVRQPFSFLTFLVDLIILLLIISVIVAIVRAFRRR
jgi:hypothetical protein